MERAGTPPWVSSNLRPALRSYPQLQTPTEHVRQHLLNESFHLGRVVPRAEVGSDHQLILKTISPFAKIIDMHVAMLMDFVFAVLGRHKGHFADQNPGLKEDFIVIQTLRGGVARVGEHGDTDFGA